MIATINVRMSDSGIEYKTPSTLFLYYNLIFIKNQMGIFYDFSQMY